jgi:hypothetical protein
MEMLDKQIEQELDVERNDVFEDYGRFVDDDYSLARKYLQGKLYDRRKKQDDIYQCSMKCKIHMVIEIDVLDERDR